MGNNLTPIDVGGNVSQILVGSVALYVGGAGSTLPNIDGTLPIVWPAGTVSPYTPGWAKVGYTDAGVDLDYSPTFKDINVDEELAPVRKILDKEKCTVTAKLAQATLDILNDAISASTLVKTVADGTHSAISTFYAGSGLANEIMIGFQGYSPQALATTPPIALPRIFVGYRVISMAAIKMVNKRSDKVSIDVSFELLADSTKTLGERLFVMVDHTAPHS